MVSMFIASIDQFDLVLRKTGSVSREIRDIQNQIRQEEGRDLRSKVEKLTRDLQTLHRENAEMATFIKSKQK